MAFPVRVMPLFPYQTVHRLGRGIGWLCYWLLGKPRRIALANLDVAFRDSKTRGEKNRIARASFQSFGATMLGLFWTARLTPALSKTLVEFPDDSLQLVRDDLARGKGVIFVMMHYGDWEMVGLTMALHDLHITSVTKLMRNAALEQVFSRLRTRTGNNFVYGPHAMLRLRKALKHKDCIGLLIDQQVGPRSGGIWCDFFGLPVLTSSAIARLALHSGAAIVSSVAYPLPDGRTRIDCREIPYQLSGNDEADIQTISQQCLRACETIVRDRPEHWLWSYKRWKNRPCPERGLYPEYSRPFVSQHPA